MALHRGGGDFFGWQRRGFFGLPDRHLLAKKGGKGVEERGAWSNSSHRQGLKIFVTIIKSCAAWPRPPLPPFQQPAHGTCGANNN